MGKYSKPAEFRVKDKVNLAKSTDVSAGVQSKVYYSITYVSDGQYVNSKVPLSKSTDVSVGTGVGVKSVLVREDGKVNGKVNLVKSTDKKGVYVEPVTSSTYNPTKEVSNQRKQQKEDRLPFGYRFFKSYISREDFGVLLILTFLFVGCGVSFISFFPLIRGLTNLYGEEIGKNAALLIFLAEIAIVIILYVVAISIYNKFENEYAYEE